MPTILLSARLILAAVFTLAGVGKLADRPGTRSALIGFGLPGPLIAPLGIAVPVAELAVGAALLPTRTTWFAAIAGLALLVVFLAVIGFNLASGRRPDCNCFGQIRSAPVGPSTIALNVGLIAVAGIVIWQGRDDPGPSVIAWISPLTTAELVGLSGGVVGFGLLESVCR